MVYQQESLCENIFSRETPQSGNVCIVGHPNGNVKQDELCPILPIHEGWQSSEIEKRLASNEQRCQNNPSSSTCFLYRTDVKKLYVEKAALAYDVGHMFNGSSGAPVFDLKCNIVALHTLGINLGGKDSVEVGVTFKAVVDHLERTGYSDFVKKYFKKDEDEVESEDEIEIEEDLETDNESEDEIEDESEDEIEDENEDRVEGEDDEETEDENEDDEEIEDETRDRVEGEDDDDYEAVEDRDEDKAMDVDGN